MQAFNRYYDQTVKALVSEFKELKETKNAFVKKFALQVYANFDESYPMWLAAIQNIAELDALMGLAKGSIQMGGNIQNTSISNLYILITLYQNLLADLYSLKVIEE